MALSPTTRKKGQEPETRTARHSSQPAAPIQPAQSRKPLTTIPFFDDDGTPLLDDAARQRFLAKHE